MDYFGVARHLKEALAAYADEDVEGALASLKDEIPILRDRHLRVVDLFRKIGIDSLEDAEACIEALSSERLRAEFAVKLKAFLSSLDTVLPRPEGLPFTKDAKKLAYIYARARNRYKDTPELGKDVGAKVRKLIDDQVISLGISPKIPPVQLTDADFEKQIGRAANQRAKASEMEHAIRSHIRKHIEEDPVGYRKLSERLNDILKALGEQWEQLIAELQKIIDDLRSGHVDGGGEFGDLPDRYVPFLRTVLDVVYPGQEIEGFLYLGRSYRLKLVDGQDVPLRLLNGRFLLKRNEVSRAREHFVRWYCERAKTWLQGRVKEYQARMEVAPSGVKVQDLDCRWGSCGKGDWLYFHWKTILLPARIAEYIVVHEIAHLHERHHTPEFWLRVERAMPDYEKRKSWLADHGMDVEGV